MPSCVTPTNWQYFYLSNLPDKVAYPNTYSVNERGKLFHCNWNHYMSSSTDYPADAEFRKPQRNPFLFHEKIMSFPSCKPRGHVNGLHRWSQLIAWPIIPTGVPLIFRIPLDRNFICAQIKQIWWSNENPPPPPPFLRVILHIHFWWPASITRLASSVTLPPPALPSPD